MKKMGRWKTMYHGGLSKEKSNSAEDNVDVRRTKKFPASNPNSVIMFLLLNLSSGRLPAKSANGGNDTLKLQL